MNNPNRKIYLQNWRKIHGDKLSRYKREWARKKRRSLKPVRPYVRKHIDYSHKGKWNEMPLEFVDMTYAKDYCIYCHERLPMSPQRYRNQGNCCSKCSGHMQEISKIFVYPIRKLGNDELKNLSPSKQKIYQEIFKKNRKKFELYEKLSEQFAHQCQAKRELKESLL